MNWQASRDDRTYDGYSYPSPCFDDRLRHLVFLDGLLIDAWTGPAEGTAYWDRAQDLDSSKRRNSLPAEPPPTPPHERVLEWLDSVVGGRTALVALGDDPLDPGDLPEGAGEYCTEVWSLLEKVCSDLFDDEFLQACRAALVALWRAGPDVFSGTAAETAGAVCWMVGRANGCVGAGTAVTQQVLKRQLWVKSTFSTRATRFKERLRGLLPPAPYHSTACPNLLELGSPAYLTSATRRDLIQLRDRALAAARTAAADEAARVVPPIT